jgi:hypothetical protein
MEPTARHTRAIRDEHRNRSTEIDMPHRDPRRNERALEAERAAEKERDVILAPDQSEIRDLTHRAAFVDAIGGHVSPQVRVGGDASGMRRARFGHIE